jgi:SecD/SecF fusion protein
VLQVEPDGDDIGQAVTDSIKVIERRLKDLGTRAVVEKRETDRILVQLSRSADVRRSIEILTRRGKLEFRLVDNSMTVEQAMSGQPPAGSEVLHDPERPFPVLVEKRVLLTGRDLVDAQAAFDSRTNTPVISFRFSADGARRFGQVTQENVGRALAIVFDNKVLSAPVIREPILGGSGQISGNLTVEDANNMAILLRAGELPGRLVVIEQRAAAP